MTNSRLLHEYCDACGDLRVDYDGDLNVEVDRITDDSREVEPGSLFVAIKGTKVDGRDYIPQAIYNGAVGVVYMKDQPFKLPVPSIRVGDDYAALGKMAAFHYGYPASGMTTIGVTGTNGKTTTAFLLRSIFNNTNVKTGLLGSVYYDTGNRITKSHMTTPASLKLQKLLFEMKQRGVQLVIMEVSSHALIQRRLGNLCFDVGIFTNLTAEHLDYHVTMEDYYNAKKLLFTRYLKPGATAVINIDDDYGKRLKTELTSAGIDTETFVEHPKYPSPATLETVCRTQKILTCGFDISSHCHPTTCELSLDGTHLELKQRNGTAVIKNSLVGRHNVYNVMSAVCAANVLDIPTSSITQGVEQLSGVSGRLQRIPGYNDVSVFVDYAHTEDALENVLKTLKPHCLGRLILVFGCGGDRDKGKRSKMGWVASQFSTDIIITSDNPRSETPESIIRDIMQGIPSNTSCRTVVDRREAIFMAISEASPGDTVLVAGKGHEEFQEIHNKKTQFSDFLVCQEVLNMRRAVLCPAV